MLAPVESTPVPWIQATVMSVICVMTRHSLDGRAVRAASRLDSKASKLPTALRISSFLKKVSSSPSTNVKHWVTFYHQISAKERCWSWTTAHSWTEVADWLAVHSELIQCLTMSNGMLNFDTMLSVTLWHFPWHKIVQSKLLSLGMLCIIIPTNVNYMYDVGELITIVGFQNETLKNINFDNGNCKLSEMAIGELQQDLHYSLKYIHLGCEHLIEMVLKFNWVGHRYLKEDAISRLNWQQ